MEMPGRRSNYTLLSQVEDQAPSAAKFSGERGVDWDAGAPDPRNRITTMFPSIGLQRQSSGSSFGESSLSGDYYVPSISLPPTESDGFSYLQDGAAAGELRLRATSAAAIEGGGGSSSKSWAQQTEESYQLQLALALRLSSEAASAEDPNFLDPVADDSRLSSSGSAESISHRFWVMLLSHIECLQSLSLCFSFVLCIFF